MEDWEVAEILEDHDGVEERWLVIFNVPEKYAHDGRFSYSFPKKTFAYRAAEFGYDIDDPDDREALFQHVLHEGYLAATGQLTARGQFNPLNSEVRQAKTLVQERFQAVRAKVRLSQAVEPALKVAGLAAADVPADVLDVIRGDMRLDRALIAEHAEKVNGWRDDRLRAVRSGKA